jgi:hypothetical protein
MHWHAPVRRPIETISLPLHNLATRPLHLHTVHLNYTAQGHTPFGGQSIPSEPGGIVFQYANTLVVHHTQVMQRKGTSCFAANLYYFAASWKPLSPLPH